MYHFSWPAAGIVHYSIFILFVLNLRAAKRSGRQEEEDSGSHAPDSARAVTFVAGGQVR